MRFEDLEVGDVFSYMWNGEVIQEAYIKTKKSELLLSDNNDRLRLPVNSVAIIPRCCRGNQYQWRNDVEVVKLEQFNRY